jgi:hypothetical protein
MQMQIHFKKNGQQTNEKILILTKIKIDLKFGSNTYKKKRKITKKIE